MPQNRRPSVKAFNLNLLDAKALRTKSRCRLALRSIKSACLQADSAILEVVVALSSRSYLLEYIFSLVDKETYERLCRWIISRFPTPTTPNVTDTVSMGLLQRLSSSLLFPEYSPTADAPPDFRVFGRKVELLFNVLKELERDANDNPTNGNTSNASRKKGKQVLENRHFNPFPFNSMGITVPTTDMEARNAYVGVLTQLRSMLERYLVVLREPLVSEIFQFLYIEANRPPGTVPSLITKDTDAGPDQSSSPAFQMLAQPMQAVLYFGDVKGFGEWSILLSTRAQEDLRDCRRADGVMFWIVMKTIKQLSEGHFSNDNQKPLTCPKMELPIYGAKTVGGTRLVYQIDCMPDLRNSQTSDFRYECQVIRIFGIFTHVQLDHTQFWDSLSQQLQQRDPDYIEWCTFRNEPLNAGNILPAVFPSLPKPAQDTPQVAQLVGVHEEDMKDIYSMLVLDKYVVLSQALLNSILANKEVAHIFSVSTQEQEIIEHPSSCYVIGRSGTGKTTTMLFKMLGIQHTWQQSPDTWPYPRQVFITQSRVLATKVEEYFAKLTSSLEAAAYSREAMDIEQEIELIDQDDNEQWRSDLPDKFSELLDEHFPLFITFDRLCTMLRNDIGEDNGDDSFIIPKTDILGDGLTSPISPTLPRKSRLHAGSGSTSSSRHRQQFRRKFVSYREFLMSYWDHFDEILTQDLDPALVFGEFMGVIKGSEGTVGTKHRCLDQKSYESLSDRIQGTFSNKRKDIYRLFTAYTKLKQKHQDYDAADRTHYILKGHRDHGMAGKKVDFLYVDEVQDNLLIDTLLLRTICASQHGLFWAGDTAQTISIGSSFRFDDLKAYQYRIEKKFSCDLGLTPVEPETFKLTLNYRSHSGIVDCARSVVELITCYWPHSIDNLKPERAMVDGRQPMFFASQGNAEFEKILFGNDQGEAIEFGADQCILVRDDPARERLQKRLGNSIIMTLYESKGLEFNDVLLYNFFENSTATLSQWRLVLNRVSDEDDLSNVPTFDETRHASICVELKFLYVAITRARKNLWIMDSSVSADPMKAYWSSKNQIEIWSSTADVPRLAVSSTPEEWSKAGKTMFLNKRYAQASVAFRRAGRDREAAICDAYLQREKALLISTTASVARTQAFVTAANAFITCARDTPSKQANERLTYYGAAGGCFSKAHDLKNAGDSYQTAGQYAMAARAYRQGGYFDELVNVMTQHRDALNSGLLERLTEAVQTHYSKCPDVRPVLKSHSPEDKFAETRLRSARNSPPLDEDAPTFSEDRGLDEARAEKLKESGGDCEQLIDKAVVEAANPTQNTHDDHLERDRAIQDNAAKNIQVAYRRYLERNRAVRDGAAKKIQAAYRRHLERNRVIRDSAARRIQAAYLRYSKRKSVVREGIDIAQARYWHLLRKRSMKMEWPNASRYYLLFRVPLVYILVCLDVIRVFVESEKKKEAEKWMAIEGHGDLEDLMEALKQYRKLLKKTIALQKKLSPSSEFHEGQSVIDLQRAVLDVKAIVENLNNIPGSIETRNQIETRWNQGWKWIFEK